MTYTATGFSNPVRVIFDAIFRPTTVEDTRESVAEHFRMAIRREQRSVYIVDRVVLRPGKNIAMRLARAAARMHRGHLNAYIAYVLLALLLTLAVGLVEIAGR
jgi:hydrogenase-4 component B